MDPEKRDKLKILALKNSIKHKVAPNLGSIMGKAMSPQMRDTWNVNPGELKNAIMKIIDEISALSMPERKDTLEKLEGEADVPEFKKRTREGLPELDNAVEGEVVTRFAPNPSGPLHMGHTASIFLNKGYADKYDGTFILRIDDTDPTRVNMAAYDYILEDLRWLKCEPDQIYYCSDRFDIYFDTVEKLLKDKHAYVCNCDPDEWAELKDKKTPCPCRDLPVSEQLNRWQKMFTEYKPRDAVVRIKTDLKAPNPADRDFPAMRILDETHPRTGKNYRVYPLMNYASAVDDGILGITHVIRGKDHKGTVPLQSKVIEYLGCKVPEYYHIGFLLAPKGSDVRMSTSFMGSLIKDKTNNIEQWDDPKLHTVRAVRKRSIPVRKIKEFWVDRGLKDNNINLDWRRILGSDVKKYFSRDEVNEMYSAPNFNIQTRSHYGTVLLSAGIAFIATLVISHMRTITK